MKKGITFFTLFVSSDSNAQTIKACVHRSTGMVRIVSANTACSSNETLISWNKQGIQGEQGLQGIQGEKGLQGIQGEKGLQGIQGAPGVLGFYLVEQLEDDFNYSNLISRTLSVRCHDGDIAVGCGYEISNDSADIMRVTAVKPHSDFDGESGREKWCSVHFTCRGNSGCPLSTEPPYNNVDTKIWAVCVHMPLP